MMTDWGPLRRELVLWRRQGLDLPIWWRDDDAVEDTAALRDLTRLSHALEVPVHLAIIPKHATQPLIEFCTQDPALIPMVHGWSHLNHAPKGQKKAEFNHARTDLEADATHALTLLQDAFGDQLLRVFTPPWNRMLPGFSVFLQRIGYVGLSTFTPRQHRQAAPGLVQINTHLDPIDWRGGGGLRTPETLVRELVSLLEDRRKGRTDRAEPLGVLTHHLVHTPEIWDFTSECLSELLSGGAHACNLHDMQDALP